MTDARWLQTSGFAGGSHHSESHERSIHRHDGPYRMMAILACNALTARDSEKLMTK